MLILEKVSKQMQKHTGNLFFFFFLYQGCVFGKGVDLSISIFYVSAMHSFHCEHLVIVMSLIYGNRSFDESTWGAFDNNDDVDSVWGFNTKTKVTHAIHNF